jgi:hypothetical protein
MRASSNTQFREMTDATFKILRFDGSWSDLRTSHMLESGLGNMQTGRFFFPSIHGSALVNHTSNTQHTR